jgi:hypothetical protein
VKLWGLSAHVKISSILFHSTFVSGQTILLVAEHLGKSARIPYITLSFLQKTQSMASLSAFIGVLKRELFSASKKTPLKTLVTILVVFALEKLLTATKTFKCPKEGYQVYGGMFLFVPAFCLSGLTLLTSSSFWDSATSRLGGKYGQRIVCSNICSDLVKAVLVGVAWLVLAFGTTDFYVCFRVGATELDSRKDEMQAESTMIAWATLVVIITTSLLYLALKKCCCSRHHRECAIHTLRDYER